VLKTDRVARFFLARHSKTGKIYKMAMHYNKWQYKIRNGSKIDQMPFEIYQLLSLTHFKMNPDCDFLV
jgi:hypothetical protein